MPISCTFSRIILNQFWCAAAHDLNSLPKKYIKTCWMKKKGVGFLFHVFFTQLFCGFCSAYIYLTWGYLNADHFTFVSMTKLVIFVGRTCERYLFCVPLSLDECFADIEARICLQCFKVKRDEKKKLKSGPMAINMSKVGFWMLLWFPFCLSASNKLFLLLCNSV